MLFRLESRTSALPDLSEFSPDVAKRILGRMESLKDGLAGDVKRLKHFVPKYRLCVGDWRLLFEIDGDLIQIWRVCHRRDVYDRSRKAC